MRASARCCWRGPKRPIDAGAVARRRQGTDLARPAGGSCLDYARKQRVAREHCIDALALKQRKRGLESEQEVLRCSAAKLAITHFRLSPAPVPIKARRRISGSDCGATRIDGD